MPRLRLAGRTDRPPPSIWSWVSSGVGRNTTPRSSMYWTRGPTTSRTTARCAGVAGLPSRSTRRRTPIARLSGRWQLLRLLTIRMPTRASDFHSTNRRDDLIWPGLSHDRRRRKRPVIGSARIAAWADAAHDPQPPGLRHARNAARACPVGLTDHWSGSSGRCLDDRLPRLPRCHRGRC